jgi:hypothetical protein
MELKKSQPRFGSWFGSIKLLFGQQTFLIYSFS